jgi:hypothetical protein
MNHLAIVRQTTVIASSDIAVSLAQIQGQSETRETSANIAADEQDDSSPLTSLDSSDESQGELQSDSAGVTSAADPAAPVISMLQPTDFQVHVAPFDSFPIIHSHLHPKFAIVEAGRCMTELLDEDTTPEGEFYWNSFIRSDQALQRILTIFTAWKERINVPRRGDDAGESFYAQSDDDEGGGDSDDDDNKSGNHSTGTVPHRSGIPKKKRNKKSPQGGSKSKRGRKRPIVAEQAHERPIIASEETLSEGTLVDHDATVGIRPWSSDAIKAWTQKAACDEDRVSSLGNGLVQAN